MEHDADPGAESPGLADVAREPREPGEPAGAGESAAAGGSSDAEGPAGTGEPRVDAALRNLRELDGVPVSEHPEIFERVHGQLVEVLGELHSAADPADPARTPGQAGVSGRG